MVAASITSLIASHPWRVRPSRRSICPDVDGGRSVRVLDQVVADQPGSPDPYATSTYSPYLYVQGLVHDRRTCRARPHGRRASVKRPLLQWAMEVAARLAEADPVRLIEGCKNSQASATRSVRLTAPAPSGSIRQFDRSGASSSEAPPWSHSTRTREETRHGPQHDHAVRAGLPATHPEVRRIGDEGFARRVSSRPKRARARLKEPCAPTDNVF